MSSEPRSTPAPAPAPEPACDDGPFRLVPSSVQLAGLVSFRHGFGTAHSTSGLRTSWRRPLWPIALFMLNLVQCRHHWARENSDETSPTPNSCFCRPRRRAGTSTCRAGIESVKIDWPWVREEIPNPTPTNSDDIRPGEEGRYLQCPITRGASPVRRRPETPGFDPSEAVEWPGLDWTGCGGDDAIVVWALGAGGLPTARPLQVSNLIRPPIRLPDPVPQARRPGS